MFLKKAILLVLTIRFKLQSLSHLNQSSSFVPCYILLFRWILSSLWPTPECVLQKSLFTIKVHHSLHQLHRYKHSHTENQHCTYFTLWYNHIYCTFRQLVLWVPSFFFLFLLILGLWGHKKADSVPQNAVHTSRVPSNLRFYKYGDKWRFPYLKKKPFAVNNIQ